MLIDSVSFMRPFFCVDILYVFSVLRINYQCDERNCLCDLHKGFSIISNSLFDISTDVIINACTLICYALMLEMFKMDEYCL